MSDPETAICCMIVSNPGGDQRPQAWQRRVNDHMRHLAAEVARLTKALATVTEERDEARGKLTGDGWIAALTELDAQKDAAYLERNKLVALLASIFPAGIKRTAIEGWSDDWHDCVYIDFPWGQASWHYHDSQAALFDHLPPYAGEWDGHTTEAKYDAIVAASRRGVAALATARTDGVAEGLRMAIAACVAMSRDMLPKDRARRAMMNLHARLDAMIPDPPVATAGDSEGGEG